MNLSTNHKRAVFSTLKAVEKRIDEIERLLLNDRIVHTLKVENDLSKEEVDTTLKTIQQTKEVLGKLMDKYDIKPHVAKLSEVIKSLKASNWVDLLDTDTKSLKRYGDFSDEESSKDLDHDIKKILRLTEKLIGR
ncbi:MAG: hypothetical protein ACXIUQ_08515 [Cecembia sp.]